MLGVAHDLGQRQDDLTLHVHGRQAHELHQLADGFGRLHEVVQPAQLCEDLTRQGEPGVTNRA